MNIARGIVRHPKLVLSLWIILTLIMAPFAMKLNEVVVYEETKLLPEASEYVKAEELWKNLNLNYTGFTAALAGEEIIIDNMYFSNETKEWYGSYKDRILSEGLANNVYSIYDVMEEISNEAEKNVTESYEQLTKVLEMMEKSLYDMRDNATFLQEALWQMYLSAESLRQNLEILLGVYGDTVAALNEAYNGTLMLENAIIEASLGLNDTLTETFTQVEELKSLISKLKYGLYSLDENYTATFSSLKELENLEKMINESIYQMNLAIYTVSGIYTSTIFDVIRVHYYLLYATDAYTNGLDSDDINTVLTLVNCSAIAPIPTPEEEFVYLVYSSVMNATQGHPELADDILLTTIGKSIAQELILQYLPPEYQTFSESLLEEFHERFLEEYSLWSENGTKTLLGILVYIPGETPPISAWQSQVLLLTEIDSIKENTIDDLRDSSVLTFIIASQIPEEYSELAQYIAQQIINASIDLGLSPTPEEIMNKTISLTYGLLATLNMPQLDEEYLRLLLTEGASPHMAYLVLKNALTNESLVMLLDIVYTFDLNANLSLSDPTVMYQALWSAVQGEVPSEVPLEILNLVIKYVIGEINEDVLDNSIREIVISQFEGILEAQLATFGIPENVSQMIISDILENYTVYIINESFAFYKAAYFTALMSPPIMPQSTIIGAVTRIHQGETVHNVSAEIIVSSPEVPDEYKGIIKEALLTLGTHPTEEEIKSFIITSIVESAPVSVPSFLEEDLEEIYGQNTSKENLWGIVIEDLYNIVPSEASPFVTYLGKYGPEITKDELNEILKSLFEIPEEFKGGFEAIGINPEDFVNDIVDNYTYGTIDVITKYSAIVFEKIWLEAFEEFRGVMVSRDNSSFVIVLETESYNKAMEALNVAREMLPSNASAYIIGPTIMAEEMREHGSREVSRINIVSLVGVLIITILVMESFVASVLPFIGIGTALSMSMATVYLLGHFGIIDVSRYSQTLLLTAPLGLGIDYATYMVRRFKIELANGTDHLEAAEIALKESFWGISASAFTDIAGFAVLMLAWHFPFMKSLGTTLPIGIAYVYISSLIVTPSILSLSHGNKWFWYPSDIEKTKKRLKNLRSRVVERISSTKVAPIIFAGIILLGALFGITAFKIERSHDYTVFLPIHSNSYIAYEIYSEKYDVGALMPIKVVIEFDKEWTNYKETVEAIVNELKQVPYVEHVTSPLEDERYASSDGKIVGIEITLSVNPFSSEGMKQVESIKQIAHSYASENVSIYVGGEPEASKELEELLDSEFYGKVLPVAILLMFVTLVFTFRGVVVSMIILLSLGISVFGGLAVTKWVADLAGIPIPWFIPIILVSVIIGVGVDYNSFYINRVRELMRTMTPKEASIRASAEFSLFIVGLSFIVASAFLALLASESWGLREMGIALSTSVFLSALFGAYLLLPVASVILGKKLWWPRKKF